MKNLLGLFLYGILTMIVPFFTDNYGLFCFMDSLLHLFVWMFISSLVKAEMKFIADIASIMSGLMFIKVLLGNPYINDPQFYMGWAIIVFISATKIRNYINSKS